VAEPLVLGESVHLAKGVDLSVGVVVLVLVYLHQLVRRASAWGIGGEYSTHQ
jgi:phosphoribulokinase